MNVIGIIGILKKKLKCFFKKHLTSASPKNTFKCFFEVLKAYFKILHFFSKIHLKVFLCSEILLRSTVKLVFNIKDITIFSYYT